EFLRAGGRRAPLQWRGHGILFVGREAGIEFPAVFERGRSQGETVAVEQRFAAQLRDDEFAVTGTNILERLAEPGGYVFEHRCDVPRPSGLGKGANVVLSPCRAARTGTAPTPDWRAAP